MSRILVLYTGGTVGCEGQPLAPMKGERFAKRLQALDVAPRSTLRVLPRPLDSASMQPADWLLIATILLDEWTKFDGFVVLHGTDTMAWTASALSFLLLRLDKPVVLTGSQLPLDAPGSDAPRNITDALITAATAELNEVVICFAGQILRGNRCSKHSAEDTAAFSSTRWPALGAIVHGCVQLNEKALLPAAVEPGLSARLDTSRENLKSLGEGMAGDQVWVVYVHPGFPAALLHAALALDNAPQGWVLACYGSGNAPDQPSFLAALTAARDQGIAVVAITQAGHGRICLEKYQSAVGLRMAGVLGGGDLTLPAAHAKLQVLLAGGLSREAVLKAMVQPLAGEICA